MAGFSWHDPALAVALALAFGTLAQIFARHLRLPGIVVLLGAGVALGPDGAGLVRPETLGDALPILVGFAVAVILFEGGLNLDVRRLRREGRSIRRLVTVGAAVTAAGGTAAARLAMGWPWRTALVFGTLVIVTGPTVITPLLRRIRLRRKVATVLEAEGVFGDAIGAIAAAVVLEVSLTTRPEAGEGVGGFALRLLTGAALGSMGGGLIGLLLNREAWIPERLRNVMTLTLALALFQLSNTLLPESGLATVVVAGLVVGNLRAEGLEDLREFKEQLTMMFVGMLFVLLAADVRVDEVRGLGLRGLAVVAILMAVVRPADVALSTLGTNLAPKERLFLAWLAPRGIVAAAVASLFAESLAAAGVSGGEELRALVFLVIALTVLVQGLSGGLIAGWLGLREAHAEGFLVLGANSLARAVGAALRDEGEEVVLLDSNPIACREAEEARFSVVYGSGLQDTVLQRARLDRRVGCIAITPNEWVNFQFARRARREFGVGRAWVALDRGNLEVSEEMVRRMGGYVLFGEQRSLARWAATLDHGGAATRHLVLPRGRAVHPGQAAASLRGSSDLLPLVRTRGAEVEPFDQSTTVEPGDRVLVCLRSAAVESVGEQLARAGWQMLPADEQPVEDSP